MSSAPTCSKDMEVNKIYLGDCLDILPLIPNESINAIITDPPYGINYQSKWCKEDRFSLITNDQAPCIEWLSEGYRVITNDGCLFTFCRWDVQETFRAAIEAAGFTVKSQVIWDRGVHGMGDLNGSFGPRHDVAWFATKTSAFKFSGSRPPSVLSFVRDGSVQLIHPTQKPVEMFEYLIPRLAPNDGTVLDPFIGSGTTAVACIKTDRKYIGIEIDPGYYKIACDRIDNHSKQTKLFY